MDSEEIEDLVGQVDDHIAQGYGTKLQLRQKRADAAYDYARAKNAINKSNAYAGVANNIGNRIPNDSVYDEGLNVYDLDKGINAYRGEQQSAITKTVNLALHTGAAFGSAAVFTNPYALGALAVAAAGQAIYNAVDDKEDSAIAWLTDNAFTKLLGAANDSVLENTPIYTEDSDKEGMASMMGWNGADAIANGIGFLLGGQAAAKGIAKMTGQGSKFYETINKAMGGKGLGLTAEGMATAGKTAADEAAKIARAKKYTEGLSGLSGSVVGRFGESVLERQGTKQEMLQNGYSEEEANRAADMNFLGNMALSSVDYIQNIKMLGTFDKIFPKLAAPVGKYGARATEYFNEGLKQVGKYDKAKDIISAFGKNAFFEGGEEGLQYAFNKGSQDTVAEGGNWLDFIANSGNELGKSFTTTEGQMSWILGGLLGGGMSAIHTGKTYNTPKELNQIWKDYNDLKTDLDTNYKINENGLYTEYNEGGGKTRKVINQDYIDTINSNSQLEAIKEYAKGKNDDTLYEAAKKKQVLNKALFNLSIGQYDAFKNQLENTDMTLDEFKAIKAVQENKKLSEVEATPEDLLKFKKESADALKIAEEFKQSYETASNLPGFQNLSKEAMMKFGEILSSQKAIESQLKNVRPEIIPALEEYSKQHTELAFPEDGKKTLAGKPDMRAKKNKETVQNNALATMLDGLENDPIQQAVLKDQYEKYKELNVANKKLLQQYKDALNDPSTLEKAVNKEKLEEFKNSVLNISKNYEKLKNIHLKLKSKSKPDAPFTVQVTDADGNVKEYTTVVQDGVHKLIDIDSGAEVDVDTLGDNYVIAESGKDISQFEDLEEEDDFDEQDREGRESYNPYQDSTPKKENFFASTGSIWRFVVNLVNGRLEKQLDENGDFVINTQNEDITAYMANPMNTPSKDNVYSWQLEVDENVSDDYLEPILKEVNARRALTKHLKPLTLDQLKGTEGDSAHRLVKMTLFKNGKQVYRNNNKGEIKPITCFMHDVDYFDQTAEADIIDKDPTKTLIEKSEAKNKAIEKLTQQRAKIVQEILSARGSAVYAPVVSKSGGILSRLPYKNGKRPKKNILGRVVKELKSLIEHKSLVPDENGIMKLMPGIGVVTDINPIDDKGKEANITVKYLAKDGGENRTETFVGPISKYKGQIVFNDVKANGETVVETPFVLGEFSEEDMNGLVDALYYFVNKQSNKITIDGKEYNLFSSRLTGQKTIVKDEEGNEKEQYQHGLIDALTYIKGGKINILIKDGKYILNIRGKQLVPTTKDGVVQEVSKEEIRKKINELDPKGLKYNLNIFAADVFKNGFVFPTKINEDGTAEGQTANSYLEFMFNGEDPRIGTDVSKDFKYVNAYMTLGMDATGENVELLSAPAKSAPTQPQPAAKPQPKPQPQPQASSKEAKKAKIEKRRQEDFKKQGFALSPESFATKGPYRIEIDKNGEAIISDPIDNPEGIRLKEWLDTQGITKVEEGLVDWKRELAYIQFEVINKINAKYDAELAALESNQPATSTKLNEQEVLDKLIKDIENDVATTFNTLNAEQKLYFILQLSKAKIALPKTYWNIKIITNIETKYNIGFVDNDILDALSTDPEKYNEFVENLNIENIEPIKSAEEVQEDTCQSTEPPTNPNSTKVNPVVNPQANINKLGEF